MPSPIGASAPTVDRGLADVALSGLSRPQKMLPSKLFYDEAGCRLFYRITELPEYYLTRTERTLLPQIAPLAVAGLPSGAALVEYGASDEAKAKDLLDQRNAAGQPAVRAYVPIDVALPALDRMRARLAESHPWLDVHPIAADFMQPLVLPAAVANLPHLGFFPGSTIGNLDPLEATRFLVRARVTLGDGARFLVGADLRKDPAILLPAYDDPSGVTAEFNRNLLVRLNREAGADFVVSAFDHRAVWNDEESRIEMYLVSRHCQSVHIAGRAVQFAAGETIHTENSYKYTAERFTEIAARAGWRARHTWTDPERLFALYLLA
jgi:dimethylhistidine N-methyltransferase